MTYLALFTLDPKRLEAMTEPTEVIEALLKHAKRTTPELSVPWLTPHAVVEETPAFCGGKRLGDD